MAVGTATASPELAFLTAQLRQLERANALLTETLNRQHDTMHALTASVVAANELVSVAEAKASESPHETDVRVPADVWQQLSTHIRRASERGTRRGVAGATPTGEPSRPPDMALQGGRAGRSGPPPAKENLERRRSVPQRVGEGGSAGAPRPATLKPRAEEAAKGNPPPAPGGGSTGAAGRRTSAPSAGLGRRPGAAPGAGASADGGGRLHSGRAAPASGSKPPRDAPR